MSKLCGRLKPRGYPEPQALTAPWPAAMRGVTTVVQVPTATASGFTELEKCSGRGRFPVGVDKVYSEVVRRMLSEHPRAEDYAMPVRVLLRPRMYQYPREATSRTQQNALHDTVRPCMFLQTTYTFPLLQSITCSRSCQFLQHEPSRAGTFNVSTSDLIIIHEYSSLSET